jgi:hypothetical protein
MENIINICEMGTFKQVVWKGHETRYEVSTKGFLYDTVKQQFCQPTIKYTRHKDQEKKYYAHMIRLNTGEVKQVMLHKMIAEAFILKPTEKHVVDHIDENTFNNDVSNLQWLTVGENVAKSLAKPIHLYRWDKENKCKGEYVGRFDSTRQVQTLFNVNSKNLFAVAQGKRRHAGGYVAEFA